MFAKDIIVIGASAGGVEALRTLASGFPPDLPAAVFIVLHIGNNRSILPELLTRSGPLLAVHPLNNDPIVNGTIYIAPPDRHLLIKPGHLQLSHGPKENCTRPAINPLFRSAAASYGSRVIGVVLTGKLDDGAAGLAEIKRRGGVAVVQDPRTALSPSMPQNAVRYVDVDHILALGEMPQILVNLTTGDKPKTPLMKDEPVEKTLSTLTCPECRGPLWEERQGRIVEYRCRVGHAYAPLALAQEHYETVERTLWSSLVALEESADIYKRLVSDLDSAYAEKASERLKRIAAI